MSNYEAVDLAAWEAMTKALTVQPPEPPVPCSHPRRRNEAFYPGELGANRYTVYVVFCDVCDAELGKHDTSGDRHPGRGPR